MKQAWLDVSNASITDPKICKILLANKVPFVLTFENPQKRAKLQYDPRLEGGCWRTQVGDNPVHVWDNLSGKASDFDFLRKHLVGAIGGVG